MIDMKGISSVHDWRNYISKEIRDAWDTFTEAQKRMIEENLQEIADREEWD